MILVAVSPAPPPSLFRCALKRPKKNEEHKLLYGTLHGTVKYILVLRAGLGDDGRVASGPTDAMSRWRTWLLSPTEAACNFDSN